jgi:nicotinamide-nucleotide amidase
VEKPVGMVWIGWCVEGESSAQCYSFEGDRERIRQETVAAALQGLLIRI